MTIDEKLIEVAEVELARALNNFDYCMPADGMSRVLEAYESAKQKEAEGWRDIASAPKDGSSFLAVVWGRVRAIKWCPAWEVWFDDGKDADTIDYENDEVFGIGSALPTHWRPLPEPPSALLSAGGENG